MKAGVRVRRSGRRSICRDKPEKEKFKVALSQYRIVFKAHELDFSAKTASSKSRQRSNFFSV